MNLIMLCGQGSCGKSTFGLFLQKTVPNSCLIRMDDIVKQSKFNYNLHFPIYLNTIETTLLSSQFETVILDFSQDVIKCRSLILNSIKKNKILCKKINFIAISLRPGYKNIILWSQKRLNKNLTHKEKINIKKVYYDFEYPTIEEFTQYNFNSILIISLDNSKYKIHNEKEGN